MFISIARPRRALVAAFLISLCVVFYCLLHSSHSSLSSFSSLSARPSSNTTIDQAISVSADSHSTVVKPWSLLPPAPAPSESQRANAAIIALVRNSEVGGIVQSMRDLERTWNHKFNYPWIFFNDEPFDDEFKRLTQNESRAECKYELIPKEHWEPPTWIDNNRFEQALQELDSKGVRYGGMASYHKMCRWNSGFFFKHPALANYKWYWRVEPNVRFFCNVDYDVFAYMEEQNKTYGFTISAYDNPQSIWTLWPETLKFIAEHPEYVVSNNSMAWLTDGSERPEDWMANGYSTCHFWSNFEIGNLDFWRSPAYQDYFNHLDSSGGFFYERWGDAPVHSVALGLFEDASKVHWFKDIGYQHEPFAYCPEGCESCKLGFSNPISPGLELVNCLPNWLKHNG